MLLKIYIYRFLMFVDYENSYWSSVTRGESDLVLIIIDRRDNVTENVLVLQYDGKAQRSSKMSIYKIKQW